MIDCHHDDNKNNDRNHHHHHHFESATGRVVAATTRRVAEAVEPASYSFTTTVKSDSVEEEGGDGGYNYENDEDDDDDDNYVYDDTNGDNRREEEEYRDDSVDDIILGPKTPSSSHQQKFSQRQRRNNKIEDELDRSLRNWEKGQYYDWRLHFPKNKRKNPMAILHWIQSGFCYNGSISYGNNGGSNAIIGYGSSNNKNNNNDEDAVGDVIESDERRRCNLRAVATVIKLLREYYNLHGMPIDGGLQDQVYVLRTVLQDLYSGGGPVWTLEKAMERGAEGLTGKKGVEVGLLPRKAFIATSTNGMISMFRIQSGFNITRFAIAEKILVRIASFASNTHGFSNIPSRYPDPTELKRAYQTSDLSMSLHDTTDKRLMAKRILNLASYSEGLFYFINSSDRPDTSVHIRHEVVRDDSQHSTTRSTSSTSSTRNGTPIKAPTTTKRAAPAAAAATTTTTAGPTIRRNHQFWQIEEEIAELFSRLATIEAMEMLDEGHKKNQIVLYPKYVQLLFSFMASAGACAFWFNGSWWDIIAAGFCGFLVRIISGWSFLAKEDRIVFEAIASVIVGLIAGLLSCFFPNRTCFVAIGLSGVLDILQGFKVVYSIIEVMGKHTVAGAANFVEGILYTTLISFFLRLGQLLAEYITGMESSLSECTNGIDEKWYIMFVPLAAIAWSGLFNPEYYDLPGMGCHGVLAYIITWSCNRSGVNAQLALFLAAFGVTFSSGLISRFTGRQAMGNTIAGLFVLVPGAYLVNALFTELTYDFIGPVVVNAAIIGTGAWTGTIVCSPTIVGTTAARLRKGTTTGSISVRPHDQNVAGPMLFF